MFNQHQLIMIEYALQYVIHDLENHIHDTADALWLGELHSLLALTKIEQQHETNQAD